MEIRRFIVAANNREAISVTDGGTELRIPVEVPRTAIEQLRRRLHDRLVRPLAWKRRIAREMLRSSAKRRHGRVRIERRQKVRARLYRCRSTHRDLIQRSSDIRARCTA